MRQSSERWSSYGSPMDPPRPAGLACRPGLEASSHCAWSSVQTITSLPILSVLISGTSSSASLGPFWA